MPFHHAVLTALAGCHLVLVVCGAMGVSRFPETGPGAVVRFYVRMAGADNGYGFFAPGVAPQFRITCTMTDHDGREWTENPADYGSQEVGLRFSGIGLQLASLTEGQEERLLRSLSAAMFGRFPDARQVTVRLEMYGIERPDGETDFPTMAEYRRGERPRWLPLFEETFTRTNLQSRTA